MPAAAFQRVLLKLSGEALAAKGQQGYDFGKARQLAEDLAVLHRGGTQLALVLGAGNLLRGRQAAELGIPSVELDHLGMLATVMNAMTLAALLDSIKVPCRVFTATPMPAFAELWTRRAAVAALDSGECIIAAGGMGQPCFTTDTTAALRAIEIGAQLLMKASTVDGIYSADPKQDPGAQRFDWLDYDEVLRRKLKVMDLAAFALCREHELPIRIFDHREPGALMRILQGEDIGSLVSKEDPNEQ